MTIDGRLEALTHNLELLSLETEKHDKQIAQTEHTGNRGCCGHSETAASCGDARTPA
jgi:hypothetical protein